MSLDNHISSFIKFCFVQLRDFRFIRPLIFTTAAITLTNLFIYCRLDHCNSLFYGFPNYAPSTVCKRFQNTAARIVTLCVRSSHIIPIIKSLHWLSVLILRFVASLIVLCVYINPIILVLCSVFDQILILFVLPLLAHRYYHTSIKNHIVFVHFHMLHLISGIIYLIKFVLH